MPVESPPFINTFNSAWPQDADAVSEGALHMRNMKSAILATFPSVTGAVTPTHTVLNALPGRADTLESNRARRDIADTFAGAMTFSSNISVAGTATITGAVALGGAASVAGLLTATGGVTSPGTINATTAIHQAGALLVPPGVISMYGGATAPAGYLLCDGTPVSRATYAALFAVIASTFGAGDGTTTFNVPNLTNRYAVGVGTVLRGGLVGSQTPAVVVPTEPAHTHTTDLQGNHGHGFATGSTAITVAQMPSHSHGGVTAASGTHSHASSNVFAPWNGVNNDLGGGGGTTGSIINVGGSAAGDHTHGVTAEGSGSGHTHGITADGMHTHTTVAGGSHTHAATIADGRPPSLGVNFIVKF